MRATDKYYRDYARAELRKVVMCACSALICGTLLGVGFAMLFLNYGGW